MELRSARRLNATSPVALAMSPAMSRAWGLAVWGRARAMSLVSSSDIASDLPGKLASCASNVAGRIARCHA